MAKHRFGSNEFPDRDPSEFAVATDVVSGANSLPKLSAAFRHRVLTAATIAFHEARRWVAAKQAASLLSICLFASLLLAPVVALRTTLSSFGKPLVANESSSAGLSVWSLRQDYEFLDLPQAPKSDTVPGPVRESLVVSNTVPEATTSTSRPRAKLLAVVPAKEGWESVSSVTAVRFKLPRAFGIHKL